MIGSRRSQGELLYKFSLEDKVPGDHILRLIKGVVDFSFISRIAGPFHRHTGTPSIDPEVIPAPAVYLDRVWELGDATEQDEASRPGANTPGPKKLTGNKMRIYKTDPLAQAPVCRGLLTGYR